jgi:hypothetical protein
MKKTPHFSNTVIISVQSGGSTPTVVKPEIFATGLSNPMGCNFDSAKPSYFYCANVNGVYKYAYASS